MQIAEAWDTLVTVAMTDRVARFKCGTLIVVGAGQMVVEGAPPVARVQALRFSHPRRCGARTGARARALTSSISGGGGVQLARTPQAFVRIKTRRANPRTVEAHARARAALGTLGPAVDG